MPEFDDLPMLRKSQPDYDARLTKQASALYLAHSSPPRPSFIVRRVCGKYELRRLDGGHETYLGCTSPKVQDVVDKIVANESSFALVVENGQ